MLFFGGHSECQITYKFGDILSAPNNNIWHLHWASYLEKTWKKESQNLLSIYCTLNIIHILPGYPLFDIRKLVQMAEYYPQSHISCNKMESKTEVACLFYSLMTEKENGREEK